MNLFDFKLTRLKIKSTKARRKLNSAWEMYQMTNPDVLAAAAEFDRLCNEYERLKKGSGRKLGDSSQD